VYDFEFRSYKQLSGPQTSYDIAALQATLNHTKVLHVWNKLLNLETGCCELFQDKANLKAFGEGLSLN
jgi:hypothetical protein